MTSKIFRSTMLVALIVLTCALGIILGALYQYFDNLQIQQLKDELRLAALGTETGGMEFLKKVESDWFRLTWIAADGQVLYDTHADVSAMGNHGDREEVQEALQTGSGEAFRHSDTLTERTTYEAQRLSDGTVLRISSSQRTMMVLVVGMLHPVSVVVVIAIVLSALLAHRMAKKIVEPLNSLNLEQPLHNEVYAEISPLLRRIHRQHNQIAAQMEKLRQKSDEFEQITGNMQEGLVLLNSQADILSINPTARRIFGASEDCVGKSFLQLDRSGAMREAVNAALDQGRGEARGSRGGREYEFDLSRIQSDGTVIGVVVLAFDITERLQSEQMRREFSANVSHELKTPLQSIIGSAELLEGGLVKPEDTARFVSHIRKEAARLVNLVGDIIRLSQLDEGVELPAEPVQLLPLAREVAAVLEDAAAKKEVHLEVSGDGLTVNGVRRLLYEIVYNLCDNAIRYNVPGGSVSIHIEQNRLTVCDTGIGIPEEDRDRVFERFYRVDKSHSRETGGTGLGLSIVKHAAQYHGASLELESTPGKGTSVTVIF